MPFRTLNSEVHSLNPDIFNASGGSEVECCEQFTILKQSKSSQTFYNDGRSMRLVQSFRPEAFSVGRTVLLPIFIGTILIWEILLGSVVPVST